MNGTRAIYKDGWWAGSRFVRKQANSVWSSEPYGYRPWELYNLSNDYTQSNNLAARYPDKVQEFETLFDQEAKRNDVYPLAPIAGVDKPNPATGRTLFTYRAGVQRIPSANGPDVTRRAHRIEADIVIPERGGDGVIIADGGRWGGFSLFVKDRTLVYAANAHGNESGHIVSSERLPAGRVKVAFDFTPNELAASNARPAEPGTPPVAVPGKGRLFINGKAVGEGNISKIVYGPYESLDIGADLGSPVSADYRVPFAFAGVINQVQVELK
jgi:arylsulfatase